MRQTLMICLAAVAGLVGCGPPEPEDLAGQLRAESVAAAPALAANSPLIQVAEQSNEAIGGCIRPADAPRNAQLIDLGEVMLAQVSCSLGAYSFTDRLFILRDGEAPELVTLPDYDASGWFATDQISMPEIDAGARIITTYRKSAGHGGCGSEGRYKWDGVRFVLEELRWRDCSSPDAANGPPYPVVWPVMN